MEDTCRILETLVESDVDLSSTGHVINLGTGFSISVSDIAAEILQAMPRAKSSIRNVEDRPAQVLRHTADQKRLSEIFAISTLRNFETGLDLTIRWYENNEKWWRKRWDSREIEITIEDGKKVFH